MPLRTKVVILTQYFPPEVGASQARLLEVAQALSRLGVSVEIATAMPSYPRGTVFPEYRGRVLMNEEFEGLPVHRVWAYAASGRRFLPRLASYASFSLASLAPLLVAGRPDLLLGRRCSWG